MTIVKTFRQEYLSNKLMKKQILITDFELRKGKKKQLGICCIKEINIEKE